MNKERKKEIKDFKEQLEALLYRLESISSDEELYYDSIPENLQCSERAETSEEAIEIFDDVKENIQEAINKLDEIF